jgi:cytochrome c peroxidase
VKTGGSLVFFRFPAASDLQKIPQDPKNPLTAEKVELGRHLYHETALAINPKVKKSLMTYSCASCHHVDAGFQACLPQGIGEGGLGYGSIGEGRQSDPVYRESELDVQPLRSPSTLNIAYQPNVLWNGQFGATGVNKGTQNNWTKDTPKEANFLGFEGVETQAIAGLTVHRMGSNEDLFRNSTYRKLFQNAFPNVPEVDRYSIKNIGLAIASYERTLLATEAPFQRWLRGEKGALSDDQKKGALLFFGKGNCVQCHTGPALNSMAFYAMGMSDLSGSRVHNVNPNQSDHKGRGSFTGKAEDMYKFKVPQLYNLRDSPFFGHGSNFRTVREVIMYKNRAVAQNSVVPSGQLAKEFSPLHLSPEEISQLTDFIENSLRDPKLTRYVPTLTPSGYCIPNNDIQTRVDRSWFR